MNRFGMIGESKMATVRSVHLSGHLTRLVAAGPSGPVLVTGYDPGKPQNTAVFVLDPAGNPLGREELPFPAHDLRIGPEGSAWVVRHRVDSAGAAAAGGSDQDGAGDSLVEVGFDGRPCGEIGLAAAPGARVGAFVVLPDGFVAVWLPEPGEGADPVADPAVLTRHDRTGAAVWSAALPTDRLAPAGAVALITADVHEPLLVSGDRVLACLDDPTIGIGACYLADLATGDLVAVTDPAPYQHKAIAGPGRFLLGRQGYGVFSTALHDRDGRLLRDWPAHGAMLVDRNGAIRGPELENTMPSRSVFRALDEDGTVRSGPPLPGYRTAYPALDVHGTTVFWRDGRLTAVDADLGERTLHEEMPGEAGDRLLLLDGGTVFSSDRGNLVVITGTGLGALDPGPWPCADGGLLGNPVFPG
jgi:hypothetical protein